MTRMLGRFSQVVVLFIGGAGFLFGQLFTGDFSLGGTLAGCGGLLAGILTRFQPRGRWKHIVTASCAIGVLGAGLHAYEYYAVPHVSGNYYAWFLTAPFALALILIAVLTGRGSRVAGVPVESDYT